MSEEEAPKRNELRRTGGSCTLFISNYDKYKCSAGGGKFEYKMNVNDDFVIYFRNQDAIMKLQEALSDLLRVR